MRCTSARSPIRARGPGPGRFAHLAETGVTVLEVMPVAEFPGRFGWGYDGVQWFAPAYIYGSPDDFRSFVDRAHSLGIGVILDVVYNHLGPDGNYLPQVRLALFFREVPLTGARPSTSTATTRAGPRVLRRQRRLLDRGIPFGRAAAGCHAGHSRPLRRIIFWRHRTEVRRARRHAPPILIAENEPPASAAGEARARARRIWVGRPMERRFPSQRDGRADGPQEAYYTDYLGTPQEFISAMKYGYLYQGQRYKWQKKRRGTPGLDMNPAAFVTFIQNHDQIANSAYGKRCQCSDRRRASCGP